MVPPAGENEVHARLRDAEAMLDAIIEHAIIQLDLAGTVVRWGPGAELMTGYSAAEMVGKSVSVLYTDEDRAAGLVDRELAAVRETGRFEFEGWRVRKDGRRFRAAVVVTAIQDAAGVVTGLTKVLRDLTAEQQRADSMFHDLLESAPDAMVIVASDGRITLANAQADRLFGYRREDSDRP
ncbi:PAS domain S-box protein [Mycolicibacterium aubagnense]